MKFNCKEEEIEMQSRTFDKHDLNLDNLKKHSRFLVLNPLLGFDMGRYSEGDAGSKIPKEMCGSVACSVGYVPLWIDSETLEKCRYGVERDRDGSGFISYNDVALEVFGIDPSQEETLEWIWLFAGQWEGFDNTLDGARCRIDYLLEHENIPPSVLPQWSPEFDLELYESLLAPYR